MTTGGSRLRVDVLGPLLVTDPAGLDRTPSGGLQRRLLAWMVLHRGRIVAADRTIDALWPDRLPADPAAALQNHVSRLRRCDGRLLRRATRPLACPVLWVR